MSRSSPVYRVAIAVIVTIGLASYFGGNSATSMISGLSGSSLSSKAIPKEVLTRESYATQFYPDIKDNRHDRQNTPIDSYKIVTPPPPTRRAIVSTLYNDGYAESLRVLGFSIKRAKVQARLIALYIASQVDTSTIKLMESWGWEMRPVERISPWENFGGKFKDQYTKLRIWEMEDLDALLYLDGDTLVFQNLDEIWNIPSDFAAVLDVWPEKLLTTFNAGVMFLRPNKAVFDDLITNIHLLGHDRNWAEQAYLNEYMKYTQWLMPYKYNANLAHKMFDRPVWNQLMKDVAIIHYTLAKPHEHGPDYNSAGIWDGLYKEEFEMYWSLYNEMVAAEGMTVEA